MKEKISIFKIGGSLIDSIEERALFIEGFAKLSGKKLLIHGGGKIATRLSQSMGIEVKMHQGRRITSKESLDVVTMSYAGLVNKSLVAELHALNCDALGLCGADAKLILAKKREPLEGVDYGYVGDPYEVRTKFLHVLFQEGLTPVIAPLSLEAAKGQLLNTNADTVTNAIALGLTKHYDIDVFYVFDKPGVLTDSEDDQSVVPNMTRKEFDEMKKNGALHTGILPKLSNALNLAENSESRVFLCEANAALELANGKFAISTQISS